MTTVADQLRPISLDGYIGQAKLKERLTVAINAALKSNPPKPMAHTLLVGGAGFGKTTLAKLVADALDDRFLCMEFPFSDRDYRDLIGFAGVLLIDEIHRGSKTQREELLTLLEHGYIKPKGRYRIDIGWLTVIGATTELIKEKSVRDRFPIQPHFEDYTDEEMGQITLGMARLLKVELTLDDCIILGRAAAGVPRLAGSLVQAADQLSVHLDRPVSAAEVLDLECLDADGLGPDHLRYLELIDKADGLIGLAPLKDTLTMDEAQVRNIERLLLRQGFIIPTLRGRELTAAGAARVKAMEVVV